MIRLASLLFPLALALPAYAQEDDERNALYYAAYYQETALRDFDAAADLYRQLLEKYPDDNGGLTSQSLGRCLMELGRLAQAREVFEAAILRYPSHVNLRKNLADLEKLELPAKEDAVLVNVRQTIERMVMGDPEQALLALAAYGTRALPVLEEGLRSPRPEVVNLSARALVHLVAKDIQAADEALGEALISAEVVLRGSIARHLVVAGFGGFWSKVPSIPEHEAREEAMTQFVEQMVPRWPQAATDPLAAADDTLLREIATYARSVGSNELRRSVINSVSYRYLARCTESTVGAYRDLALACLDEPSVARWSLNAATFSPAIREVVLPRMIEYVEALPVSAGSESSAKSLLESGDLTIDQYVAALQVRNQYMRASAWNGLVTKLDRAALPEAVLPLMPGIVEDRISLTFKHNSRGSEPEYAYWARFGLRKQELPAIWDTYRKLSELASWVKRSRSQVVAAYLAGAQDPSAAAEAFLDQVPGRERDALSDLLRITPRPDLSSLARRLTASPEVSMRIMAYELMLAMHTEVGMSLVDRPPHLLQDLWTNGDRAAGSLVLARESDQDLLDLVDGYAKLVNGEREADQWAQEVTVALLILLGGPESCAKLLPRAYELRDGETEQQLDERIQVMFDILESYWEDDMRRWPGLWTRLAEVVAPNQRLTDGLYGEVELDHLPVEEAAQLIRRGLTPGVVSRQNVAHNLIEAAGQRDLGVEPALLLPFIQHPDGFMREVALKSLDMLERYASYRLTAASFGADTKLRAIETIQRNVASGDPTRRVAAAHAIAALGDVGGVATLLDLIEDDDASVRAAALTALERMGGSSNK
ncbi:MAG: tetratricopeptide repeat protein [Planctomycetota bacterium]|nr:tetratricopeptide repeat protein [Planctomycetota bacterium]